MAEDTTLANALAGGRAHEPMIGGEPPVSQWSWEFQKPLLMDWLRNSLATAPLALPGRAPLRTLRGMDTTLRPLTAAELEMAEVYKRLLDTPAWGSSKPFNTPPSTPARRAKDPPSFYDMWEQQSRNPDKR